MNENNASGIRLRQMTANGYPDGKERHLRFDNQISVVHGIDALYMSRTFKDVAAISMGEETSLDLYLEWTDDIVPEVLYQDCLAFAYLLRGLDISNMSNANWSTFAECNMFHSDSLVIVYLPETAQHVTWQREYLEKVEEIAKTRNQQYIVITQSPSIVHDKWDWMVDFEPEGE